MAKKKTSKRSSAATATISQGFQVKIPGGPELVIEGCSTEDEAIEAYKKECGIIKTERKFEVCAVEIVEEEE